MKKFKVLNPEKMFNATGGLNPLTTVEADFIYAQPSGVSTLHRFRAANTGGAGKSDIVAVVPANLLILEV